MLTIDRLKLSLPSGFEKRADGIARLVASELAAFPVTRDAHVAHLSVPAVQIAPHATDRHIASAIAGGIRSRLGGPR